MLCSIGWHPFEQRVGEASRLQGYRVAETDDGVDLVLPEHDDKDRCRAGTARRTAQMPLDWRQRFAD